VEHRQVAAYLVDADAFVSASVTEVQPMTFLEALAAGTPVVAVESAAARDLADSGGLTMSAATASDLSRAIVATLRVADRAAARRAARSAVAAFDVRHRAAALADAYVRAIAGPPLAPTAGRPGLGTVA
jgi:1,2-diacylglycerol 3-alpha-glucosyltransferase